jgi:hypothetical protein
LKFKKSLFVGALDGGESEIFLGGSRLTRFMETVDKAAGSIPAPPPEEPPSSDAERSATEVVPESDELPQAATPADHDGNSAAASSGNGGSAGASGNGDQANPWNNLLNTGLDFLRQLSRAAGSASEPSGKSDGATKLARQFIQRDPDTGRSFVKFPMPEPQVLDQFVSAVKLLLGAL